MSSLKKIANKVLDNALPIQQTEKAIFLCGKNNQDIVRAFADECQRRKIKARVEIEKWEENRELVASLVEDYDWIIRLIGCEKRLLPSGFLRNLCLQKRKHLVVFLDPSDLQAKKKFLASLDVDYPALTKLGRKLISRLRLAKKIHLLAANGTDLTLSAVDRSWANDDGNYWGKPFTPYLRNLPVGEVFVAPIENSAKGVLVPATAPGDSIKGLRIEFQGKKSAIISAKKGLKSYLLDFQKATGNPYCIAEFAIGTNPCADPWLATEKTYGTVHIAIGQNTWLGGKNESSLHRDFLILKPTVILDDKTTVLKDRIFKL